MKFKITESIDWDKVQWGVHQFSTESIIFRGTEEECQKYIDERPELWDDAEVYKINPDDPYYLKEAYDDKIELEYDNIKFTQVGKQRDVDDWDEWEREASWTLEVDKDDIYEFIYDSCITEDDFPAAFEDDFDPNNEDHWNSFVTWLDNNFDDIFNKYMNKILDNWEENAIEDAELNYDPDDYIDWDSMPSGHDDYDIDEALEESIYTYQTWIQPMRGEKQPSKTLTYGSDIILVRSPYTREEFGKDWRRHIKKIIEWCQENNPGLIRLSHDFRLNNFPSDPNSEEAFIAAIEDKLNKGEYILRESINESKEEKICCICKEPYEGYGNNAEPVCSGTCCNKCNIERVIPMRFKMMRDSNGVNESLNEYYGSSFNGYRMSENDFAVHYMGEDQSLWNKLREMDDDEEYEKYQVSWFTKPGYYHVTGGGDAYIENEWVDDVDEFNSLCFGDEYNSSEENDYDVDEYGYDSEGNYVGTVNNDEEDIDESKSLTEGNPVTNKLPASLDNFLQDMAQMTQVIDYGDIMDHDYSEEDIKAIKKLYREWREVAEYDDEEDLMDISSKVAEIFNKKSISLNESVDTYTLTYYEATATRERRPETLEDIENDWKVETFHAANDTDALKHAVAVHCDTEDEFVEDDCDVYDIDSAVEYLNNTDWGDGSRIIIKLEGPNGILYDTGHVKEDFIELYNQDNEHTRNIIDEMEKYDPDTADQWRKIFGLDEAVDPQCGMTVKHRLIESTDDIDVHKEFLDMKQWLVDNPEISGTDLCYDGEYADFVDTCYYLALENIQEEYPDLYIESNIQGGKGSVDMRLSNEENGSDLHASWDFEVECDNILEYAQEASVVEDFISSIESMLRSYIDNPQCEDDDFDDDYSFEHIDEMLNEDADIKRLRHLYGVE